MSDKNIDKNDTRVDSAAKASEKENASVSVSPSADTSSSKVPPIIADELVEPETKNKSFLASCFSFMDEQDDDADSFLWEEDAHKAWIDQKPIKSRALLYSLLFTVAILLIWSAYAEVDQVTKGEGKVIPSQHVQIIQSLDGGVVTEILVREGDIVEAGQLLVKLDPTRFVSTLRESRAEFLALSVKAARLKALADSTDFAPSQELRRDAEPVVNEELILYNSSKAQLNLIQTIAMEQLEQREQELAELQAKKTKAEQSLTLAQRELDVTEPLVASGAVSEVELLRLKRDVVTLSGDIAQATAQIRGVRSAIGEARKKVLEVELNFKNEIREELSSTLARISALRETNIGLTDRVKQTDVRSSVKGTVKRLYYNTVGGVVLAGKEVAEVVPLDDSLLLEARIVPQDIAFLHPGQKAHVKFTAYDYVVYGGLDAQVEHIGADTVMDEDGNPFYVVRVRTLEASLGKDKPIIPGMVASVDILTGKKTVLAYILKPVLRAKQYALSEL